MAKQALLCVALVAVGVAVVAAGVGDRSDKVDSDLVFDNIDSESVNELETLYDVSDSDSDVDADENEHWLARTTNRIKRSLSGLLGSPEEKHAAKKVQHRKKTKREKNLTSGHHNKRKPRTPGWLDGFDFFKPSTEKAVEEPARITDDTELPQRDISPGVDDDDSPLSSGAGSSGDGETDSYPKVVIPDEDTSTPKYYRFTFTLLEPYRVEYSDRNTQQFQETATRIKRAMESLFQGMKGEQTVTVVSISPKADNFEIRVTSDVESRGLHNADTIRNIIQDQIQEHRLAEYSASPDDFTFRQFDDTPVCEENQLTCKSSQCVPLNARCNRVRDCNDNSDEEGCEEPGPAPPFTTTPPPPVPGYEDEGSGDDAILPPSPPARTKCRADDVVRCADGSKSICADQRCDGIRDCEDSSDETGCGGECAKGEISCDVTRCIPTSKTCDGVRDCDDGTDEAECPSCRPDELLCDGFKCIPREKVCDRVADCANGLDEANCQAAQCPSNQFDCGDGQCIPQDLRCNSRRDCSSGRDEENCRPASVCRSDEFECESDGKCIPNALQCNRYNDCEDGSDEADCPQPQPPPPPPACELRCRDGSCVPHAARCDGRRDCSDGTDEEGCRTCQPYQYQCSNGQCIDQSQRCDRRQDCYDGSDERGCPPPPTIPPPTSRPPISCPPGHIPCNNGNQCIEDHRLCDGRVDCNDLSDESNCVGSSDGLDLKTYPTEQEIKENIYKLDREVVFRCRDEGPLRARVHWERPNNLPLPPGSRDKNGRLEIPNIALEHGGTYLCVADGYPPNTPGAQVSVHLNVERDVPPPTRPPSACALHQATCSNGDCIDKNLICDGRYDCTDGSDEIRCNAKGCEPNEFRCNNKKCILKTWRCDSDDDCGDGSDEASCATNPPGSYCAYHQFACHSGNQCIPRSYHCDLENDCIDGSDEVGCAKPIISKPPPPMVHLQVHNILEITCTAVGIPTPEIIWRLNWGHIPPKCRTTSQDGFGRLICEDIQVNDQGAYSCEAINIKGSTFAQPDTILVIQQDSVCRAGYFNVEATTESECIKCFCFGHSTDCKSADLFIFQFQPPFDTLKLLGVRVDPYTGVVDIRDEPIYRGAQPTLEHIGRNGVSGSLLSFGELLQTSVIPYFALPENYYGNQLKSYGGYLRYTVHHTNDNRALPGPDVIITGNGYTLLHEGRTPVAPYVDVKQQVRFFEGEWLIKSESTAPRPATREEIMMTLAGVNNILIKMQYNDGILNTTLFDIEMDSAAIPNSGLGAASYVEECRCPVGYTGTSCERCADGYVRQQSGPWLGQCYREPTRCPPGQYNDGRQCQVCPCPHTNPSNQFGRTCHLNSVGTVICDCPPGYRGDRCEQCDTGYTGNPLVIGDSCRPVEVSRCDPDGSYGQGPDGQCRCKDLTTGPTCNQCKDNTFFLSASNQFGCIPCFCMGITTQCTSSNWYRNSISSVFTTSTGDFKLIDHNDRLRPITSGLRLNAQNRELTYSNFTSRNVYYWSVPSRYLGDKVTSYGGNLRYTIRHTPIPGGASSRNSAADIELVSDNTISLLYFSREPVQPSGEAQTFTVPLLEQYWQRSDGEKTDREHLLMTLADLSAIYIKATYYTNTLESSLVEVSLDVAEEHNTGYSAKAPEVEHCLCPPGYTGTSCEDCDVGYTRSDDGLYLGLCQRCTCNGHSNECHPESGVCYNCRDYTTGENCENCLPGYSGDPTNGIPCRYTGGTEICQCDPRGSYSNVCRNGICSCKSNVEGDSCNHCKQGTFGLSLNNTDGCEVCFCAGVASECSEGSYYVDQIPFFIIQGTNFSLTPNVLNDQGPRITDNFVTRIETNEIGYNFMPSNRDRLFWSLPSVFTGNKIKSYGGRLEFKQRFTQRPHATYVRDQDVIITGNGVTIYWSHPVELRPEIANSISVRLHKNAGWNRLDNRSQGPKPASREDILTALANIDSILIRATQSSDTSSAYLSDITLDTAVTTPNGNNPVIGVEVCRCPPGYTGTSCESCASGYYRDLYYDQNRPLGSCTRCNCNGREQSCAMGSDRRLVCHCQLGWTGQYCEESEYDVITTTTPRPDQPGPPSIIVEIQQKNIEILEVGSTLRLNCSAQSRVSPRTVRVRWDKFQDELPDRAVDDGRGLLVITNLRVSDSGRYICQAHDGYSVESKSVDVNVGVSQDRAPTVSVSQPILDINEGEVIEMRCIATGVPTPDFRLIRTDGGQLNSNYQFNDGVFRIDSALPTDRGYYQCIVTNRVGSDTARFELRVTNSPLLQVYIEPNSFRGQSGETVRLTCRATGNIQSIRWSRRGNDLPYNSREDNGVLTIYNARPEDSGEYLCAITSLSGHRGNRTASVLIEGQDESSYPTASVHPERSTVSQGTNVELTCEASAYPAPTVKWTRVGSNMGPNVEQIGNTLYIKNVQPDDRGVYVCVATNRIGSAQSSAILEITRLEAPRVSLYPHSSQIVTAGGSTQIQCRVEAGIPHPTVTWSRTNGQLLSHNVEEMSGGTLRFMQVTSADEGEYMCSASNDAGRATAVATIVVHVPPQLYITPEQNVVTVIPGSHLRLECRGEGVPPPEVSWEKHSYGFGYARNDPVRSRSSYAIQEFHSITEEDEGYYICKGESPAGAIEKRIQVIVDRLPERGDITGEDATSGTYRDNEPLRPNGPRTYDEEFVAPVGTRAELRCKVSQEREQIFIKWERPYNASLPPEAFISGNILYIDNVQPSASGDYTCLGISSSGVTLFNITTHLKVVSPPRITLEPPRQIVKPGSNAYIDCRATGEQPIEIVWMALDRQMPSSVYTRQGYLRFNNIKSDDAGKYRCMARNSAGEADAVAEVIVEENVISKPTISAEKQLQATPLGSTINLRCTTHNTYQNSQIRWFRQSKPLPQNSRTYGEVLRLENIQYEDEGRYYCEIVSDSGTSSDYIDVQVTSSPTVKTLPSPSGNNPHDLFISPPEEERRVGETVDVNCQSNEPGAIITWKKMPDWLRENVQTRGGNLRITNLQMNNAGSYRCEASGRQGVYHKDYHLYVIDDDSQDDIPLQVKTAPRGSSVILVCNTNLEEPVSYLWSKQGGHLPQNVNIYDKSIRVDNLGSTDAGTYVCSASSGARTVDVPIILVVTGIVPYFPQAPNSYIAFPTLPDAYIQFNFEISFKPENDRGLILYNGNKGNDRRGDYISLALENSVPVFKIYLGHSTTTLRAEEPITEREWHTIKVIRHRKKITMYVDGKGPYTTEADGKYIGLDLSEPLYLGSVPDFDNNISPEVNVRQGFVGCISRLKIGHGYRDILKEALNKTGITNCETCSDNKCENQGACQEALSTQGHICICPVGFSGPTCGKLKGEACSPYSCGVGRCIDTEDGFECQCPLGRIGKRCEREITVNEPAFSSNNNAYLAYPPIKPNRKLKINLKFKPKNDRNGILLYSGETEEGHGDFLSLAIKDRHVEFRFSAGDHPIVVRSEDPIVPGQAEILTAIKSQLDGRLTVSGGTPGIQRITSNHKIINLNTPLYIGGVDKHRVRINDGVGVTDGFDGCITEILVSGMDISLISNVTDSANIEECAPDDLDNNIYSVESSPEKPPLLDICANNPCLNRGTCYPTSPDSYGCSCTLGFSGRNCEIEEDLCNQQPCKNHGTCHGNSTQFRCDCTLGFSGITCEQRADLGSDAHFEGNGYLEFSSHLLQHEAIDGSEIIALEFSTNKSDGLIFWHGQTPNEDGQGKDYISLSLSGGYLEFSFDLGTGPAIIQNREIRVDDGERHSVILKRTGTQGSIEVDHTYTKTGSSIGSLDSMDCKGNIYLGGVPNYSQMTGNRFRQGFDGCIHGFELQDSKTLDLGMKAIKGVNVRRCSRYVDSDYSDHLLEN